MDVKLEVLFKGVYGGVRGGELTVFIRGEGEENDIRFYVMVPIHVEV